jgi:class 3 adenylate cyclase
VGDPPQYICVLDPDRYEFVASGGRRGWLDKLDDRDIFLTEEAVLSGLRQAAKKAVSNDSVLIDNTSAYIKSREKAIADGLRYGVKGSALTNVANSELREFVGTQRHFVIASIDIVGSTQISQAISSRVWANVLQVYSREIAHLCRLFHGRPLQFAGDGAILYFPVGSVLRKHDFASDCAISLRDLVLDGINPAAQRLGLPALSCRIGVDSGEAWVETMGDVETTNQIDIVGHVISLTTKIEKLAGPNEICFGEAAVRNMHSMWLRHTSAIPTPFDWPYVNIETGKAYGVYRIDFPSA